MLNNSYTYKFKQLCLTNSKFKEQYYKLGKPEPFDVTLRDGLQSLSKEQYYTMEYKLELYKNIVRIYEPENIEIGSIVSEKVLPVFSDTLNIYDSITNQKNNKNNYILIPNRRNLSKIICLILFMQKYNFIFDQPNSKMNQFIFYSRYSTIISCPLGL